MSLLQEAALDDQFNNEMKKIQGALDKLRHIISEMSGPSSVSKPLKSQASHLFQASRDLNDLGKIIDPR